MTNSTALALVTSPLEQAIIDLQPIAKAKAKATVKSVNCAPKAATVEQQDELCSSAYRLSLSRAQLAARVFKLLGATPTIELFDLVSRPLAIGFCAGALVKKASIEPTPAAERKLFTLAAVVLYSMASPDTKELKDGQVGRRDGGDKGVDGKGGPQQKAARTASASVCQIMDKAGVTNPHRATSGGGARKPRPPVADDTAPVAPVAEIVLGKGKSFAELLAYFTTNARGMSRTFNNNAKAKPERAGDMLKLSALVGDFAAGIALLNK